MFISCWKYLGSLDLVPSKTLLTAFDGISFRTHGIFLYFDIKLTIKIVSVQIEFVDAPLDYNLLLRRSWAYAMCTTLSYVL